jgi:hypothetical protein
MRAIPTACAALLLFAASPALAGQIGTSTTLSPAAPNWQQLLTFSQFDPTLGILNDITFQILTTVQGSVGLENASNNPASITATMGGAVTVERLDTSVIGATQASVSLSADLPSFDGTIDFAGTSGTSTTGLSSTSSTTSILTGADDLSAFTGPGTIYLAAYGVDNSFTTGGDFTQSQFLDLVGGTVLLTYDYTSSAPTMVPEPRGMLVFGAGLAGLGAARWRRSVSAPKSPGTPPTRAC